MSWWFVVSNLIIPLSGGIQTEGKMVEPSCKTCGYARPPHPSDQAGRIGSFRCHRFPPTDSRMVSLNPGEHQPLVRSDDWCGEFEDKDILFEATAYQAMLDRNTEVTEDDLIALMDQNK